MVHCTVQWYIVRYNIPVYCTVQWYIERYSGNIVRCSGILYGTVSLENSKGYRHYTMLMLLIFMYFSKVYKIEILQPVYQQVAVKMNQVTCF